MSDRPITHPQTFVPSRLAAGEDYASVAAILECSDLPEATLHIPHWRIGGKAAAVRVRALSLEERERVQQVQSTMDQYCLTWHLGCLNPPLTIEQANALRRKNPHAVEQGANFIWLLSALDQEWIAHVVETQTNAPPAEAADDGEPAADRDDSPRVRRVA